MIFAYCYFGAIFRDSLDATVICQEINTAPHCHCQLLTLNGGGVISPPVQLACVEQAEVVFNIFVWSRRKIL